MRTAAPFKRDDLDQLGDLLELATAVVSMEQIFDGARDALIIGMRHDVDNDLTAAVEMALWEADRGYRSTYYILHTAPYWDDGRTLRDGLETIAGVGHEIGIHNNALADYKRTGNEPATTLQMAIARLRRWGHKIRSTVAHGDNACYGTDGNVEFVNDQLFTDCDRPEYGAVTVERKPLGFFGLDFDANWIGRGAYLSDSGGNWSQPGYGATRMTFGHAQLHMLVHPCWWADAFEPVEIPEVA